MNSSWAIRLSLHDLQRAGALRSWPDVDAAVNGDTLWLRGDELDSAKQRLLAPIADGPVYQFALDGRLTPFGNAVPTDRLQDLHWTRLADFLHPVLPVARMSSVRLPRVALSLERSLIVQQEVLLVTDWDSFSEWGVAAPEIRLHACRFAVCRVDGADVRHSANSPSSARVVIQGNPLPPLDGERFWLAGRVAVPLGYRWTPSVDVATLEAAIGHTMADNEGTQSLWIWNRNDHTIDVVEGANLIPLTRANIRATLRV